MKIYARNVDLFTALTVRSAGVVPQAVRQVRPGRRAVAERRAQPQQRPGDRLAEEQLRVFGRLEVSGRQSDESVRQVRRLVMTPEKKKKKRDATRGLERRADSLPGPGRVSVLILFFFEISVLISILARIPVRKIPKIRYRNQTVFENSPVPESIHKN